MTLKERFEQVEQRLMLQPSDQTKRVIDIDNLGSILHSSTSPVTKKANSKVVEEEKLNKIQGLFSIASSAHQVIPLNEQMQA